MRISGVQYATAPRAAAYAAYLAIPPRLVVLHDTGNNSSDRFDEASFAANRTDDRRNWTSAHSYTDPGGIIGSLDLSLQAWAAKSYGNANGWHIEMCRTAAGVHAATRAVTAPLVRQLCQLGAIPMVKLTPAEVKAGKRGVCGHRDFTLAGIDGNDHDDPGASFPWVEFMQQVNATTGGTVTDTQNVLNTAALIEAFVRLDPLADGVVVPGYSDANNHAEVPAVVLLTNLRDKVQEIHNEVTGGITPTVELPSGPLELSEATCERIAAALDVKIAARMQA